MLACSLQSQGAGDACARCAQGVADGNGAAVGIDMPGVIRKTQCPGGGQYLAGKGFVEFKQVNIVNIQVEAFK